MVWIVDEMERILLHVEFSSFWRSDTVSRPKSTRTIVDVQSSRRLFFIFKLVLFEEDERIDIDLPRFSLSLLGT